MANAPIVFSEALNVSIIVGSSSEFRISCIREGYVETGTERTKDPDLGGVRADDRQ